MTEAHQRSEIEYATKAAPRNASVLEHIGIVGRSSKWLRAHLDHADKDACLIWPFSRNESGYALYNNPSLKVHRLMCEYRNGPPPEHNSEAAHSCGNGHLGCVNPNHLTWKSRSENLREMYQQGRRPRRYKLTTDQAAEIRALRGTTTQAAIAQKFGVTPSTIRGIFAGQRTKAPSYRVFTEDEVRLIRSTASDRFSAARLSREFGVSITSIYGIRKGQTYRWVTP